ncbi:uncharacterized protein LOC115369937 isoform X2 [Myripristis murdjan]|uniref:uncharacterized protein LOC115369937 isoform X2 n=1 Tax=Myripristis murdjan TaxID=586833 RepID=UPI001175DDD2|nr:uncharacterized protein LOC115369937 isoform X2 [Myripristis murdjan]
MFATPGPLMPVLQTPKSTDHSDYNMLHTQELIQPQSRQTPKPPSFTSFAAVHKTSQGSIQPKKQRRWGAMHVCIAWQIYYHKQVKKMQVKPHNLHQELVPEFPSAISLTDIMQQHKELVQSSCICSSLESPRGQSQHENVGINFTEMSGTIKKEENISQCSKTQSPDQCYRQSPAPQHRHPIKREKLDWDNWGQSSNQRWHKTELKMDETRSEKKNEELMMIPKAFPLPEKSVHLTLTPETHSGSHKCEPGDRKRQLECGSHVHVKRLKQEVGEDDQHDSSKKLQPHPALSDPFPSRQTHTSCSDPPLSTMPEKHIALVDDMAALYSVGNTRHVARTYNTTPGGIISYPAAGQYPYPVPSWEAFWDVHRNKDPSNKRGYFLNREVISMPDAAWWLRDKAFHCIPPAHVPFHVALRQQEDVCLRGRQFLHSLRENYHPYRSVSMGPLHQSGPLTSVYPAPHVSNGSLTHQRLATSARFARLCP